MRWLFLLLLVLNGFYYVWHQQEAPLRAKEVMPLSLYRGSQQDIRLLSESVESVARRDIAAVGEETEASCIYLGGFLRREVAQQLEQRLKGSGVETRLQSLGAGSAPGFWLRISPESRHLLDDVQLQNLAKEFNELKHKIMPCEGVATGD
ncbi:MULTISPECIES: hypothetical protein [Pseudomonas]|uniref:Sporulation domain-containing protein n=1 Tax=Pseudomonas sessilinigenes TaxID=658629 RepID=A0ABX8MQ34_9PSED|nr:MULTISPECIES: hypothetical protein [Pseudomonas]QIH11254.1 hypothetical protein ATY02_33215 [Pseudomonas sp. BIOMIG1BAC]QXH40226.1 hypothetical protein KSS89_29135 [Pseudomonas sessilinigenes]